MNPELTTSGRVIGQDFKNSFQIKYIKLRVVLSFVNHHILCSLSSYYVKQKYHIAWKKRFHVVLLFELWARTRTAMVISIGGYWEVGLGDGVSGMGGGGGDGNPIHLDLCVESCHL